MGTFRRQDPISLHRVLCTAISPFGSYFAVVSNVWPQLLSLVGMMYFMWFIVSGFHFVLLLFPGSLNIELCPALSIPVTWSKHALGIRYGHVSLRHGRGELRVAEVITS